MTFGDGASEFYPMVALDVSAHEVSHGFTEQHSKLIYEKQSGGINEAFSDMAGEAAKFFAKGSNDFLVGHDIMKTGEGLRYMMDPARDGSSIGSAKDYNDSLDVHYSSGVYNKAFYTLATAAGWDTKKAFLAFAKANQNYWEPSTDYLTGAIGVCKAARDLGYSQTDVEAAFASVNVMVPGCRQSDPLPPSVETELFAQNGSVEAGGKASFGPITVKPSTDVTVQTTGTGNVDLYVKTGSMPSKSSYLYRSNGADSHELCKIKVPATATKLYMMLVGNMASTYQAKESGHFCAETGAG